MVALREAFQSIKALIICVLLSVLGSSSLYSQSPNKSTARDFVYTLVFEDGSECTAFRIQGKKGLFTCFHAFLKKDSKYVKTIKSIIDDKDTQINTKPIIVENYLPEYDLAWINLQFQDQRGFVLPDFLKKDSLNPKDFEKYYTSPPFSIGTQPKYSDKMRRSCQARTLCSNLLRNCREKPDECTIFHGLVDRGLFSQNTKVHRLEPQIITEGFSGAPLYSGEELYLIGHMSFAFLPKDKNEDSFTCAITYTTAIIDQLTRYKNTTTNIRDLARSLFVFLDQQKYIADVPTFFSSPKKNKVSIPIKELPDCNDRIEGRKSIDEILTYLICVYKNAIKIDNLKQKQSYIANSLKCITTLPTAIETSSKKCAALKEFVHDKNNVDKIGVVLGLIKIEFYKYYENRFRTPADFRRVEQDSVNSLTIVSDFKTITMDGKPFQLPNDKDENLGAYYKDVWAYQTEKCAEYGIDLTREAEKQISHIMKNDTCTTMADRLRKLYNSNKFDSVLYAIQNAKIFECFIDDKTTSMLNSAQDKFDQSFKKKINMSQSLIENDSINCAELLLKKLEGYQNLLHADSMEKIQALKIRAEAKKDTLYKSSMAWLIEDLRNTLAETKHIINGKERKPFTNMSPNYNEGTLPEIIWVKFEYGTPDNLSKVQRASFSNFPIGEYIYQPIDDAIHIFGYYLYSFMNKHKDLLSIEEMQVWGSADAIPYNRALNYRGEFPDIYGKKVKYSTSDANEESININTLMTSVVKQLTSTSSGRNVVLAYLRAYNTYLILLPYVRAFSGNNAVFAHNYVTKVGGDYRKVVVRFKLKVDLQKLKKGSLSSDCMPSE